MFVMHNPVRFTDPTGLFAIIPNFPNFLGPLGGVFGQGFVTSILNQATSNMVLLASGNKKEMLAYGVDGKGVGHKAPSPAPSIGGHVSGGGGGTIGGGTIGGGGSSTVTTPPKVTLPKPKNALADPQLTYVASPKHGTVIRGSAHGVVNPAPQHGQAVLNNSIQIKPTSPRRIGVDTQTGQFNVFDQTSPGIFHGHTRSWKELTIDMQNALRNADMVDNKGNILGGHRSDVLQ